MDMESMYLLIYLVVGVMIAAAIWNMVSQFLPWISRRRMREKPRDGLQKLLTDLKLSAKMNRERDVRYLRIQGDTTVLAKRRYRIKGIVPDSRCYIIGLKLRRISLTSILLCPPELCTFLNSREISIRARAVQRWNGLVWVPVLTERDVIHIRKYEKIWQNYLDYATIQMGRVEFAEVAFGNWYEAADGGEYQDFVSRQEKAPGVEAPKEQQAVEETV